MLATIDTGDQSRGQLRASDIAESVYIVNRRTARRLTIDNALTKTRAARPRTVITVNPIGWLCGQNVEPPSPHYDADDIAFWTQQVLRVLTRERQLTWVGTTPTDTDIEIHQLSVCRWLDEPSDFTARLKPLYAALSATDIHGTSPCTYMYANQGLMLRSPTSTYTVYNKLVEQQQQQKKQIGTKTNSKGLELMLGRQRLQKNVFREEVLLRYMALPTGARSTLAAHVAAASAHPSGWKGVSNDYIAAQRHKFFVDYLATSPWTNDVARLTTLTTSTSSIGQWVSAATEAHEKTCDVGRETRRQLAALGIRWQISYQQHLALARAAKT